jgi:transcription antitermination factor NusG
LTPPASALILSRVAGERLHTSACDLQATPWRHRDSEALQISAAIFQEQPPLLNYTSSQEAGWFAVYTSSRHEKQVAKQMCERGIESFLPLTEKAHHWRKRATVRLQLPLFPNYLFVHIALLQRRAVLQIPGVLGIVGCGPIPCPLPDAEIEMLRTSVELGRVEPHPYLDRGERVRIQAGPMAGLEGILLRKKNDLRLILSLDLIQRSVAVEIDTQDVEPVLTGKH